MYFAKFEMNGKNDSLKKVAGTLTTLAEVVDADRKAGAPGAPKSLNTRPVPWQEGRCQVLARRGPDGPDFACMLLAHNGDL